jgi:V8-like Glu-specific endopeptidase
MVRKSAELATPEASGADARPLTREELERYETIKATEPPPRGSLLQGARTLFVSAPLGVELKPVARATAIGSGDGRKIWRVDLALPKSTANPRLPLQMERVPLQQLRAELRSRSTPAGFRPAWANASFVPRAVEKPAEHPLYVKSRRVRPLYLFDDRRQPVTDANYPWWCVGLVKSNRGQGSGVLIGSNIVLTAGHAVPWDAQNPWMTFSPGWNIPTLSLGEWPGIFARGYVVPVDPQNFDQVAHDVALLELNYPLGDTLGYFGANEYSDDWDGNGYWISTGYPEDWGGNAEFEDSDTVEDSDSNGDGLALETEASLLRGDLSGVGFKARMVRTRVSLGSRARRALKLNFRRTMTTSSPAVRR